MRNVMSQTFLLFPPWILRIFIALKRNNCRNPQGFWTIQPISTLWQSISGLSAFCKLSKFIIIMHDWTLVIKNLSKLHTGTKTSLMDLHALAGTVRFLSLPINYIEMERNQMQWWKWCSSYYLNVCSNFNPYTCTLLHQSEIWMNGNFNPGMTEVSIRMKYFTEL